MAEAADELWARAMQDAQALLEKEPQNAQAAVLKKDIRQGKFEMESRRFVNRPCALREPTVRRAAQDSARCMRHA